MNRADRPSTVNICFHGVGQPQRSLEPGEERYWISTKLFMNVLDLVADHPRARLSFDDGNDSDARIALPALRERRMSASFFLLAGRIGQRGSLDHDDAIQLASAGMTIGSHGMNHRSWRSVPTEGLVEELDTARLILEQATETKIDAVACPLGEYDRRVLREIRNRGYARVMTSDRAYATEGAWLQPRFSVRAGDDDQSISKILSATPSRLRAARAGTRILLKTLR
jgi:peptidoglycan/xylan/chitin deacetylase (PgdA/CDA1 family)